MTLFQFQTFISDASVTVERKPFKPERRQGQESLFRDPGTARANIAATTARPGGTTKDNWAVRHSRQTVLQQHCAFFDSDGDGIIWPWDTFRGFHSLGFNVLLSSLAVLVIHSNLSYPTCPSWIPDPFFRIWLRRIHKDKHGSDTGTFDPEGRFVPQHFEDVFAKYAPEGQDGLTLDDVWRMLKGQRVIADPIGWFAAFFEWIATYILLWPEDGIMRKEDIRRIYDGSLFYEVAARRKMKKGQ